MKNEEKAIEILKCAKCTFRNKANCCAECFDKRVVITMAEWKDEQFFPILQSVCQYSWGGDGNTYKCAKGDNFDEVCSEKNCKILHNPKG